MSAFSPAELAYLRAGRRLGRLATIDPTGQPHVVPLGWRYNPDLDTIDISGHGFARTRKFRNAQANPKVAFVVDDVLPPFRPRCVMVQGSAQALDAETAGGSTLTGATLDARHARTLRTENARHAVTNPRISV